MSADADHMPGHTVVDIYNGRVRLSYRRPNLGKPDEFVRLLYTPSTARDLANELLRVAEEIAP